MRLHIDGSVENVYLFVSDTLRYDSVSTRLSNYGTVVKAVASATNTTTSYPSILSGRYPTETGVWTFSDVMDGGLTSMFDYFDGDIPAFWSPDSVTKTRAHVTSYTDLTAWADHVRSLESPFLLLDNDPVAHLPYSYDTVSFNTDDLADLVGEPFPTRDPPADLGPHPSAAAYQQYVGGDIERQRQDYRTAVDIVVQRFGWRLELLRHLGVLDNTLVVFIADHGEELGEYGRVGHGFSPVPETVYVPAMFYMESGSVEVEGDFMALIDLLPTIADIVGEPVPEDLPGESLLAGTSDQRQIFSAVKQRAGVSDGYMDYSVWDADGAYLFSEAGFTTRTRLAMFDFLKHDCAPSHRRRPLKLLNREIRGRTGVCGKPNFSATAASELAEEIRRRTGQAGREELSAAAKERLKRLGYSDEDI